MLPSSNVQKNAGESIDMPVIKPFKAYIERKKEEKLGAGYKTPVTERNVNTFVDRQNVDEACNPRQYGRGAKMA